MGDLFGDAFAEDSSHRIFGRDILEQNTQFSFSDLGDLAVSKSNNVSFLKVDDLDPDLRNILVVGDSFICYSVTAKRTSIRAIDTVSGEKALLKGHESFILDLKLSLTDNHTFCSVDHGSDANKPHIFVWSRSRGTSLEFKQNFQCKLPAKMVQSFPKSGAWGISNERYIGVLTTENAGATQYEQLPICISLEDEKVSTFTFSPNGEFVAAIVHNDRGQQYLQVWRLLEGGRTVKIYEHFHNQLRLNNVVSLAFLSDYIVTVSHDDQSFGSRDTIKTIPYTVKLWSTTELTSTGAPSSPPRNIQTLMLNVPEYRFRNNSSTSLANPNIECDLRLEPNNGRYLMFSSRKSNVLACLALSPEGSGSLPIHHVTFLDFKAPIVSMDVATILGREHHSSEEGEHVEVAAYQEEAADQSSIQQYHMLAKSLFDYSKYSGAAAVGAGENGHSPSPGIMSGGNSPNGHPNNNASGGSTILNMLSRVPSNSGSNGGLLTPKSSFAASSAPLAGEALVRTSSKTHSSSLELLTPTSAAANSNNSSSNTNSSNNTNSTTSMRADKAALDALQSRSAATAAAPATPQPVVAETSTATTSAKKSDLPDFLLATTPKNNTPILSAFNRTAAGGAANASGGLGAILAAAGGNTVTATPATAAAKTTTTPAATTNSVVAAASSSPAQPVAATNNVSKTLLSTLKAPAATATATNTATNTVAPLPASAKPADSAPSFASITAASNNNKASAAAAPAAAAADVSAPAPVIAPNATSSLLSVLGKGSKPAATTTTAAALAAAAPASAATSAPATAAPVTATAAAATPVGSTQQTHISQDVKQELLREMHHLHTATITEMRTLLHQQHQVAQRNVQDLMQQMKTELTAQIMDTLTTKVQQQLSTKLKESMRDTIRDTIRSYLQDAFRNAFESSLLPAFQSGIDRMFEQVNSSVDDGMEGVLTVLQEQHQEAVEARAQVVSTVSETAATLMKHSQQQQQTSSNQQDNMQAVGVTPEMIGSVMKAVINVETMWNRTEQTVSQLQEMMAQMQSMMIATNQMAAAAHAASLQSAASLAASQTAAAAAAAAASQQARKPTPDELLAQGKIAEAITTALDNKNVDETVDVLAKLTPTTVIQHCAPLIRLCITQQLASDLSVNEPTEGIAKRLEWIKSLVVTIVRLPKAEMDKNSSLKRNFPSMIQAVLESIQAAKEWIAQAQYDNGEDDGTIDIPHTVHTDLQLLELVVQNASF